MNLRIALSTAVLAVSLPACSDPTGPEPLPEGCTSLVTLDHAPGDVLRLKGPAATSFPCILVEPRQAAGHEYLLLFENLAPAGPIDAGLFPGPLGDTTLAYTLSIAPAGAPPQEIAGAIPVFAGPVAGVDHAAWDFGAGRIREHHPEPAEPMAPASLRRARGMVALSTAAADPVVGDTIHQILLEALPHLGLGRRNGAAVIRYVSDDVIIAEDVGLDTLARQGGGFNTPIADEDLAAIAAEYTAVAQVQGDLFFENHYNDVIDGVAPNRVIAVHSLTPADEIWGYTYAVTNYFVWDYWVSTDGSTKGLNQHPQRVADNLFMHEISHMRHSGLLQRSDLNGADRGNRWLVEGFARFAERLPIAARLLGTTTPSRTGNIVLPRNPAFGNAYFLDDVPTYLSAGSSMYFGYQTSSFVFDYFADQVALAGGDWMSALREFLVAGSSPDALDDVVERWLPGTSFIDLFTRARIALYTDDIGTPGLPSRTQYHQYRIRESRPAPAQSAALDPRIAWPRISMAATASLAGSVASGAAAGFILEGAPSATGTIVRITGPAGAHALLSLARIR